MILHVAPSAPVAVRLLADAALAFHLAGGATGLAAGTVAMVARKGGRLHRLSGEVFFFAMLAMSGVGAVVAPMIHDTGSALAGAITFYLVITGWQAGRRREVKGGPLEIAGVALLGAAIVAMLWLGYRANVLRDPALAETPGFAFYVIAAIAALLGALDLKVILGPVLVGPARLARHIWRMGLGLWIALMSALAQPKVGGVLFHGPTVNLQWVPVGLLVAAIAYWLIRVRRSPRGAPRRPRTARPVTLPVQEVLS